MFKIEYDINLNDKGRPYIFLPDNYEQNPEDRFFVIEITRYILGDLLARRNSNLDTNTVQYIGEAERLLGQIGDEMSAILFENMEAAGELKMMMGVNFHIEVENIEERDNLPNTNIIAHSITRHSIRMKF